MSYDSQPMFDDATMACFKRFLSAARRGRDSSHPQPGDDAAYAIARSIAQGASELTTEQLKGVLAFAKFARADPEGAQLLLRNWIH